MKYKTPGQHKTVAAFRDHLQRLDPAFDCDEQLLGRDGPLGQPFQLGDKVIGNRFATQPMEGWDGTRDGRPTEQTKRRWRHFGESGAKLIWGGEAFAVQEDGRANPSQLFRNPAVDVAADLADLLKQIHAGHREQGESLDDLYIGLQLTHSGRFAQPDDEPAPRLACHQPALDAVRHIDPQLPLLSDTELEAIGDNFVKTAALAANSGFDFVDVKCCHGYLLHELLGARTREGSYGGSFDNRVRLLTRIIEGIRSACPDLDIAVRVSIADLFPFAPNPRTGVGEPQQWQNYIPYTCGFGIDENDPRQFDWDEPMKLLGVLCDLDIRLVNLSLGSPYYCPHLQRPATYPPSDGYLPPEDPLLSVLHHLRAARLCKQAFGQLVFVGTGYSYLQEYLPHVAQHEVGRGHVDFVGLGRMLLSYPQMAHDVLEGRPLDHRRICRTFSDCTTAPRNSMISGCYPLDPYYKKRPEAVQLKQIKKQGAGQ